jgi:hypothetical protein
MPKDVARAQAAVGGLPLATALRLRRHVRGHRCPTATWSSSSTCCTTWTTRRRLAVLDKVRRPWAPRGRLLLRVGDAANQRGFAVSQWVDRVVTWCAATACRPPGAAPLPEWKAVAAGLGFAVRRRCRMSQGTPFANVLLVADLQGGAA